MSFYGQVVYEFTKLFNKFKFKNSGISNENFPEEKEPVSEFNYEANERWDELTFETGNRWVQMVPDMSAKSIKVFHAKPSDKVLNSSTFLPKDEVLPNRFVPDGQIQAVVRQPFDRQGEKGAVPRGQTVLTKIRYP